MRLPFENGDLEERQAGLTFYKSNQLNGVGHSGPLRNFRNEGVEEYQTCSEEFRCKDTF